MEIQELHGDRSRLSREEEETPMRGTILKTIEQLRNIYLFLYSIFLFSISLLKVSNPVQLHPVQDSIHDNYIEDLETPANLNTLVDAGFMENLAKGIGYDKSGYLFLPSYVMRTHGSRKQQDALRNTCPTQMQKVFEALDTLGNTKWRVNEKVLSVLESIWDEGGNVAGLVDREDVSA